MAMLARVLCLLLAVAHAERRVVNVDGWPKSPNYSGAIVNDGTVYLSGMIGVDMMTMKLCEGGIKNQTVCAFKNIETVLEAAGSSLSKVVDCTIFIGDLEKDYDALNEAYQGVFPTDPPARAAHGAAAVAMGAAAEFKCVATL